MRGAWTTAGVREAEDEVLARTPDGALMQRAAHAVAVRAAALLTDHTGGVSGRRVLLVVGAGNNGGDALWAGAFLRSRGVGVAAVLLAPEKAHAAGLAALRRRGGRVPADADVPQWIERADLVVDGVVGISARGPLRPAAADVFDRVTAPVLAVDLPSGVDPDTGAVDGPAVAATATVTFGARKPVHLLAAGRCGDVTLVDLGLPLGADHGRPPALRQLDVADVAAAWPVPAPEDDKYTQGVAGIAAGSATYPGAAVLAAGAAVRATSGMVRYAGPAADEVRSWWPEVVATGSVADAGRVQAWSAGPGLGTGRDGSDVLAHVLGQGVPVCADADAITLIATRPEVLDARDPDTPLVLTPHDGEFARLTGDCPGADRVTAARDAARRFDAVVLLKGHCTLVAAPDGRVLANRPRGAWLATAGSGDVLSGILGALLAAGLDPWLAAGAAADVHARAGEIAAAGAPTSASQVLTAVPEAIRRVRALCDDGAHGA
ncbi:yjeF C-terminal region, hydroxyethylthiazole kinase-related/yjeF N-terminal region [Prauserella aidingensis]|uniref:NAD(P)H-hydrate dehydratase n=1 Tax=Prauserella aidingensis TaxID=387890 RepID=UPI0020A41216|nr:NAD(P)H-hydrate dehydratase [Prauserella aidingensis]MCP2254734.1 yjeF C-terminal region, hydroxyethylthiazole kinase-related/yjeF N-terminal region [Prauserella aidingensis]